MGAKKYTGEIKSYNFSSFSDHTAASETYNFQSFELQDVDQSIIAKEHGDAKSSGFAIGAEIKKQRGHAQYELDQYNIKIQQEVESLNKTNPSRNNSLLSIFVCFLLMTCLTFWLIVRKIRKII